MLKWYAWKYVVVLINKAFNNVVIICKKIPYPKSTSWSWHAAHCSSYHLSNKHASDVVSNNHQFYERICYCCSYIGCFHYIIHLLQQDLYLHLHNTATTQSVQLSPSYSKRFWMKSAFSRTALSTKLQKVLSSSKFLLCNWKMNIINSNKKPEKFQSFTIIFCTQPFHMKAIIRFYRNLLSLLLIVDIKTKRDTKNISHQF